MTRWLRDVANARVHATTREVPLERLAIEAAKLQHLHAPYAGRSVRSLQSTPAPRAAILGCQHPLSGYDEIVVAGGGA